MPRAASRSCSQAHNFLSIVYRNELGDWSSGHKKEIWHDFSSYNTRISVNFGVQQISKITKYSQKTSSNFQKSSNTSFIFWNSKYCGSKAFLFPAFITYYLTCPFTLSDFCTKQSFFMKIARLKSIDREVGHRHLSLEKAS